VTGEAGMLKLFTGLIRIPDVAFITWDRLPDRRVPEQPIAAVAPELAVEVISKGNTVKEMDRKLQEYFAAGAGAVWMVYPKNRTIVVYGQSGQPATLGESDTLHGDGPLAGFSLSISDLFAELDRQG
jgi:Uma2 family endonuclease